MIIEAQVKDRNIGNGEWSKYVIGKDAVEKITVISENELSIKMKDATLIFYNCPFYVISESIL